MSRAHVFVCVWLIGTLADVELDEEKKIKQVS